MFAPAFRVGFGLGVARADQAAAAGGGKVGGEPLPERKFVEPGPGREPPRPPPQPGAPGDVPTAGAEGRKDVRLPPGFQLRAEGAQRQIVFEVFEGGFDLGAPEVKLPPLGRGASAALGAPKITAFAPACLAPLVAVEPERKGGGNRLSRGRQLQIPKPPGRALAAPGFPQFEPEWTGLAPPLAQFVQTFASSPEVAPAPGALLAHPVPALGQHVEFT